LLVFNDAHFRKFLPAIRGDLMFPTSSLNTESGGSFDTLVNEIKNPKLRGDKPATTCVSLLLRGFRHCSVGWNNYVRGREIFNKSGASRGLGDIDSTQFDRWVSVL